VAEVLTTHAGGSIWICWAGAVDGRIFGESFSRTVPFERDLVVRSPMIVGCPDRTLDPDDDVRTVASGR
jgi:hypothetical protein